MVLPNLRLCCIFVRRKVARVAWWMGAYAAPTPKRHYACFGDFLDHPFGPACPATLFLSRCCCPRASLSAAKAWGSQTYLLPAQDIFLSGACSHGGKAPGLRNPSLPNVGPAGKVLRGFASDIGNGVPTGAWCRGPGIEPMGHPQLPQHHGSLISYDYERDIQ